MTRARPYILLLVLGLIIYLPVMLRATAADTDFGKHIDHALALPESEDHIAHLLFHAVFLLIHHLAPDFPVTTSALLAILLVMLPIPLMAFIAFKMAAGDSVPDSILIFLALALTIMAPITIWSNRFLIGYINPIVYHNPTSIVARLFVIPMSLLALRVFQSQPYSNLNQRVYYLLLSGSVVLLGTLAKPSFTFALLPGCCLFAAWRVFRRERVDWLLLGCGICLPGMLLMGLQYLLTFASSDAGAGIAFGFLTLMQHWIPVWRIPVQFVLSLMFPLVLLALYFEQARRSLYLSLCWVIFAASAVITYTLYEEGLRFQDGNFLWTSYNAIFLLMFASLLFLIEQHARERRQKSGALTIFGGRVSRSVAIASFVFGLHVFSGMAYYYRFVTQF